MNGEAATTAFTLPQVRRQKAPTAERGAGLQRGGSLATAVLFSGKKIATVSSPLRQNLAAAKLFSDSVWIPAMISTPTKIRNQRDCPELRALLSNNPSSLIFEFLSEVRPVWPTAPSPISPDLYLLSCKSHKNHDSSSSSDH
ncbi:hypothetical protein MRB53_021395 [Persea americana]|uniref:Uncharacterized protein n=1 Tax=Persea americana TaxID=3435 RepID=A0ACC2L488_PERAE|nr:hypothetical protein MRB53_021395 [Persea americana]